MEDVLLEHENEIENPRPVFSILSFAVAMLSCVLIIIMLSSFFFHVNKIFRIDIVVYLRILLVSAVIGFILGVICLVKKEKLKYLKLIGIILNFLYFAFFLVAVCAALWDIRKAA